MKFHREGFNFPFSKSLSATQPRPSSRMDLSSSSPPSFHQFPSNFVYQRRARSELYLSRTGYRVFDCRESRCPSSVTLVPGFIPLYRNFRYHFTSLDYSLYVSREREIRWNRLVLETTRVAKTRERKREKGREREKPMRLVLFGNLLSESLRRIYLARLSSCAIDSTRLHFSFQVEQITASFARASFPLA